MLDFKTLRATLLGFAGEPIELNHPDSQRLPISGSKVDKGFRFEFSGQPQSYEVWISPNMYHSNVGYMGLRIRKTADRIDQLVFRVCASNAGKTYEYTFNFIEGMPLVSMRQGLGGSVSGNYVRWQPVRCIDRIVFDLIELMMPPQMIAHRPKPEGYNRSTARKPCFVCGNMVLGNWETCGDCNNVPVATMP